MSLLKFHAITDNNSTSPYWANPRKIVGVMIAMVPGEMAGPDGKPIGYIKAGLDMGTKIIVVDESPEEAVHMIDAALDQSKTDT